ncbi:hypothetical protein Syun_030949 [Stephania yunnanensis]|uniref:IREH1/IRE-like N-terminal domain-containing protein n=1 Tax=Stephania yunnanensis TaxID=152371 RepID=A0AAP0DZE5_9MAGN
MSKVVGRAKRAGKDSESQRSEKKRISAEDFDLDISSLQIRERAQKDDQKKSEETIASVAETVYVAWSWLISSCLTTPKWWMYGCVALDISSMLDDAKSKLEKDRFEKANNLLPQILAELCEDTFEELKGGMQTAGLTMGCLPSVELLKGETPGHLQLPTDKALLEDPKFRYYVELYAKEIMVVIIRTKFERLKEEVNSDLSTFAGDLVSILEDSIDSHPEWRTRLEDLLIVARECAVMSASDFWKRCESIVQNLDDYRQEILELASNGFTRKVPDNMGNMQKLQYLGSATFHQKNNDKFQVAVIAPNIPAMYEAHFGVPMARAVGKKLRVGDDDRLKIENGKRKNMKGKTNLFAYKLSFFSYYANVSRCDSCESLVQGYWRPKESLWDHFNSVHIRFLP